MITIVYSAPKPYSHCYGPYIIIKELEISGRGFGASLGSGGPVNSTLPRNYSILGLHNPILIIEAPYIIVPYSNPYRTP